MKKSGEKSNKYRRHAAGFALLLAAALLFGSAPALASSGGSSGGGSQGSGTGSTVQQIDPNRTDGSVSLKMEYSADGTKKPMTGGTLSLYTVAPVVIENGVHFDTSAVKFSKAGITGLDKVYDMTTDQLDDANPDLASKLAEVAMDPSKGITADTTRDISEGKVTFTGLKPGLYLIVQTKDSEKGLTINPFLVTIPDVSGNYAVIADSKPSVATNSTPPPGDTTDKKKPPVRDKTIPQTGQLWWPVPFIAGAGVALLIAGGWMRRRARA